MEVEKKASVFEMNTVNIYDTSTQNVNPVLVPKKKKTMKENLSKSLQTEKKKETKAIMSKTLPNQNITKPSLKKEKKISSEQKISKQTILIKEKIVVPEDDIENSVESEINEKKDDTTVNKQREMLTLLEFSNIIHEYSCTRTSRDDTIRNLDSTLLNNEPKKGRWLLEAGDDIDFLDRLAMEKQYDNRARGRYVWNEAIENIIMKYAPDIDKEKEYEALKIMDESYIMRQNKESIVRVEEEDEEDEEKVQEESNIKTENV